MPARPRRAEAARRWRLARKAPIATPVYFPVDQATISDEGIRVLDQKVDALQRNPSVRIRVEGNADDSGSDEYNMALSQRRAGVVNRYLADRGIDASRVQIASFGEEKPACTASRDDDCRAKNRRDEFVILSGL
jgi:peptidoglycan-associated lipoprotein